MKPTNNKIAVDPFSTAWKKGKDRKSALPNDRRQLSGKNINAATTKGIIIDNITINGI